MPEKVRVRYAPSPTGEPHLGNVRTALFDWLFARRHGGAFILRIEDTDQKRLVPEALSSILEALEWLGLDWDEGPVGTEGGSQGSYGPYSQSQRLHTYHTIIRKLLEKGAAYSCFCSSEQLAELRQRQQQEKRPPGYDGRCRDLPPTERKGLEEQQLASVVRFRIPQEGTTTFTDLVRGPVTWENRLLDDMVLLKSDGFPTYHLAHVVDDHLMEISHVIRGEEWIPSTPRHILLYQALGWEPPAFAHSPVILGPDRARLSKRHGATSALTYRDEGYLPEAFINFLALLGWSLDDKTEIISREELVAHFSIERITRAPAVFDQEKLTWMNGVYIRRLSPEALADRLLPFLERPPSQGGLPQDVPRPLVRSYLMKIVPLIQERLKKLNEGPSLVSFFFQEALSHDPSLLRQKGMDVAETLRALEVASGQIEAATSWDAQALEEILRPLALELGLKTGQLFGVLRAAVTGQMASPPLFQTMEVLGRERCLARLQAALEQMTLVK